MGLGYKDEHIEIPCLFFVDDGIILAQREEDLVQLIGVLERSAEFCGLKLNRNKCSILTFNAGENQQIAGIKVEKEFKYLGMLVGNVKGWSGGQINKSHEKSLKMSNYTYSIIGGSCNRLMVGKTYWKNVALPGILYGQEILPYNKGDLLKMQRVENKTYRTILGLPTYTAITFLRGEIGSSSFHARDMKSKISYYKYALYESNNPMLRVIINREKIERSKWFKKVEYTVGPIRTNKNECYKK